MEEAFVIPLNGLPAGGIVRRWRADTAFFAGFEGSGLSAAEVAVTARAECGGPYWDVDCGLEGRVVVECDRCLGPLELPVRRTVRLRVRFGEESGGESGGEDTEAGREVIRLPEGAAELDLSQVVYDYTVLSLPLHRVHEEGECAPEALRILNVRAGAEAGENEGNDSPFAALKGLFEEKQ